MTDKERRTIEESIFDYDADVRAGKYSSKPGVYTSDSALFAETTPDPENVYSLNYKGYVFGISKRLYTLYCRHFGFLSEDDVTLLIKTIFRIKRCDVADKIKEQGESRVAGYINHVLLEMLVSNKMVDGVLLNEDECGYSFPKNMTLLISDVAKAFEGYRPAPVPKEMRDILKRGIVLAENTKVSEDSACDEFHIRKLEVAYKCSAYTFDADYFDCGQMCFASIYEKIAKELDEKIGAYARATDDATYCY